MRPTESYHFDLKKVFSIPGYQIDFDTMNNFFIIEDIHTVSIIFKRKMLKIFFILNLQW